MITLSIHDALGPGEGPPDGAAFRRDHLVPALLDARKASRTLVVSFAGLPACPGNFLAEAFGDLMADPRIVPEHVDYTLALHGGSAKGDAWVEAALRQMANGLKRRVAAPA